jgi:hypothetical protein
VVPTSANCGQIWGTESWKSVVMRGWSGWRRGRLVVIIRVVQAVDGQLSGEQVGVDVVGPYGGIVILEMAEEASAVFLPGMSIESAGQKSEADVAILAGVADLDVDLSGVGVEFLVAFNAANAEFAGGEIGLQIGLRGNLNHDMEAAVSGTADADVCGGAVDICVDARSVVEVLGVRITDADLVVGGAANLVIASGEVKRDAAALREVVFDGALNAAARRIHVALVDPEGGDEHEYDETDCDDFEDAEHGQTSR